MKMMNEDGLNVKPLTFSDFEYSYVYYSFEEKKYGDLTNLLNMTGTLVDKDILMQLISERPFMKDTLNAIEIDIVRKYPDCFINLLEGPRSIRKYSGENKELRKILVIGDSYREGLMKFLPFHFSCSYSIAANQIGCGITELIMAVKPDIVVEVHTERFLNALLFDLPSEVR
jgi:hypothetical protein